MILTVTPNPSLDRTYEVPSLDRGEVIRATGERMDPGGKGVNVSRAVAAAGRRTVAVLPLGGAPGALVAELLDAQGIEVAPVPVAGATRSNIALAESDGVLTKINAPGPELSAAFTASPTVTRGRPTACASSSAFGFTTSGRARRASRRAGPEVSSAIRAPPACARATTSAYQDGASPRGRLPQHAIQFASRDCSRTVSRRSSCSAADSSGPGALIFVSTPSDSASAWTRAARA